MLEFRILGPLQLLRAGREVALGGRKQRAVLALLLLDAGRVVSAERLIEDLWLGRPPPSAAVTLRSYISRLRALLHPDAGVTAQGGGYVLEGAALHVDAERFEELVRAAEDALARGFARTAADRFRSGLALWRGRALADVAEDGPLALESGRLEELRLSAVEGRIEAELALGLHTELIGELERLVGEHPLRERLWRQLMLALYRCDRQADALAAYARVRELLTTELGLEPSEELRSLQHAVLRQEVPAVRRLAEQHNLPAPLSSLIGRDTNEKKTTAMIAAAAISSTGCEPAPRQPSPRPDGFAYPTRHAPAAEAEQTPEQGFPGSRPSCPSPRPCLHRTVYSARWPPWWPRDDTVRPRSAKIESVRRSSQPLTHYDA